MRFEAIQGKNNKNFIKLTLENVEDKKILEIVRSTVSRTEFLPFVKNVFNRNITESYLIYDTYIPAQFWQDVNTRLNQLGYKFKLENSDILYNRNIMKKDVEDFAELITLPEFIDLTDDAYFYQLESVYRALVFKNSRIEIATGGGKTLITYIFCKYLIDKGLVNKILIVINRQSLVKQTAQEFENWDNLNRNENQLTKPLTITTIFSGGKKQENSNVIIGTYQSLKNYDKDYFDEFQCIIFDEAHSTKAYSIKNEIYSKCYNLEYILGMTATWPEYKTLDYLNIVAMLGPLVYQKTTKEAIDDGNIVPITVNRLILNYDDDSINYIDNIKNNNELESIEKYREEKTFFERHLKRNLFIKKLCSNLKKNTLILVESVEYCIYLKELLSEINDKTVDIIYGNISASEREIIKTKMEVLDNMILIGTYETMSTGISIRNIHYVMFPNSGKSKFRINQGIGRGVRLHSDKEKLIVFDFVDNIPKSIMLRHSKERLKIYDKMQIPNKNVEINL